MPTAVGQDRLIVVKRAISVFSHEITDEQDVWELQRELMEELMNMRKVKVVVVSGGDRTEVADIDA